MILTLFQQVYWNSYPLRSPTICNTVNLSLSTGTFPSSLTAFIVTPLLIKPSLDKEDITNYRSISNIFIISKTTERIVKTCLLNHLSSNSLLNPYQSAYYQKPLHQSYLSVIAWPSLQCDCTSTSFLSMPSWSICCLRHPWPLYTNHSAVILGLVYLPSLSVGFALIFHPAHLLCL